MSNVPNWALKFEVKEKLENGCFEWVVSNTGKECIDTYEVRRGSIDWHEWVDIWRKKGHNRYLYASIPRYIGVITCGSAKYGVLVWLLSMTDGGYAVRGDIVYMPRLVDAICKIGECLYPRSKSFRWSVENIIPTVPVSQLSEPEYEELVKELEKWGDWDTVEVLNAFREGNCTKLDNIPYVGKRRISFAK